MPPVPLKPTPRLPTSNCGCAGSAASSACAGFQPTAVTTRTSASSTSPMPRALRVELTRWMPLVGVIAALPRGMDWRRDCGTDGCVIWPAPLSAGARR